MAPDFALPTEPLRRAIGATATLAFVAGFVDVVGFIALFGLFTAHVTGNFVIIGSEIVQSSSGVIAKLLALPVFVAVVGLTRVAVLHHEQRDRPVLPTLLAAQTALLALFMLAGLTASPIRNPDAAGPIFAGLLGVAAMAVQNALSRLVLANHPATTIMTGNTTQAVIDFVDMYRGHPEIAEKARDRVARMAPGILAFALGAILGAYGFAALSFWCLATPIIALLTVIWIVSSSDRRGN